MKAVHQNSKSDVCLRTQRLGVSRVICCLLIACDLMSHQHSTLKNVP